MSQLLITGGAGFIGSHVCLSLLEGGNNLVVIDDFSNSSRQSLQRVCELASVKDERRLKVFQGDIRNPKDLQAERRARLAEHEACAQPDQRHGYFDSLKPLL